MSTETVDLAATDRVDCLECDSILMAGPASVTLGDLFELRRLHMINCAGGTTP